MGLQVRVGDIIRGYDFKPCQGRGDCFVEGRVRDVEDTTQGYAAYRIVVTRDLIGGVVANSEFSRVGQTVYVPHKVAFMEYAGRVMNLSR